LREFEIPATTEVLRDVSLNCSFDYTLNIGLDSPLIECSANVERLALVYDGEPAADGSRMPTRTVDPHKEDRPAN